jgi:hypothetical protein
MNDRDKEAERGHSTDPNGTRPQLSTEKSGKNSADNAKPTEKENGALAPGPPVGFQTWQRYRSTPMGYQTS